MRTIQNRIQRAVQRIEREENVKISFGRVKCSFSEYGGRMTVKEVLSPTQVDAENERLSKQVGFTQNVVGMKFTTDRAHYVITEIRVKNHKYPVIVKKSNNKLYKYEVDTIRRLIGGDKIINRNANLDGLLK